MAGFKSIHPSIFCQGFSLLPRVVAGANIPAVLGIRWGYILDRSPVYPKTTSIHTSIHPNNQPHSHSALWQLYSRCSFNVLWNVSEEEGVNQYNLWPINCLCLLLSRTWTWFMSSPCTTMLYSLRASPAVFWAVQENLPACSGWTL